MNREHGFTMVEMLMAFAILGFIIVALATAVQQIVTVPEKGNVKLETLDGFKNAIHWLGIDAVAAKSAVGGGSLTLTLPDDSTITYQRSGTDLIRTTDFGSQPVAVNVTGITFTINNKLITINMTLAPDNIWNMSESRTYLVRMRCVAL